jgi:hypothetical protein
VWQRRSKDEERRKYTVIVDVELFLDLAVSSVLGDDSGLDSDLGLARLDLGSGVFYYWKLFFGAGWHKRPIPKI